ncbi:hypothetical protein QCA50_004967 [Cerrena zonata]|uniref:Uncharacterized protein n=1 Tax=Cerrena zonata TaxID=2478898 RepID=A0AAW0GDI2_9APHY
MKSRSNRRCSLGGVVTPTRTNPLTRKARHSLPATTSQSIAENVGSTILASSPSDRIPSRRLSLLRASRIKVDLKILVQRAAEVRSKYRSVKSRRHSAPATYSNAQLVDKLLPATHDFPKQSRCLQPTALASSTTIRLPSGSLGSAPLYTSTSSFAASSRHYAEHVQPMPPILPTLQTGRVHNAVTADPLRSLMQGSRVETSFLNTSLGLELRLSNSFSIGVEQPVLLWDIRHAAQGLPAAHNTDKESDHATPLWLNTLSSPLAVPSSLVVDSSVLPSPGSLPISSMLRCSSTACRPLLVDPAAFRLSSIEEEAENLFSLLTPTEDYDETRCIVKEDVGVDSILDQLEAVALEVKELSFPEPHLARWRRQFNLSVMVSDSEDDDHDMSRNLRNAVALSCKDVSDLDSPPSTPSEDLFDGTGYYSGGDSRRPSLDSSTHASEESSSSKTTGDSMFATFTLPPVLANVPELANVQRHPKLVKTLGLDSPRKTPPSPEKAHKTSTPFKILRMTSRKRRHTIAPHSPAFRPGRSWAPVSSQEMFSKPLPPRPSKMFQTPGLGKLLQAQKRAIQRRNTLPSPSTSTARSLYSPRRRASERTKGSSMEV